MLNEWKNWCRLCGDNDNTNSDLYIKDEQFCELSNTIQNLLSITIANLDETTPKICTFCRELVVNFMKFSSRARRLQEMFTELYSFDGTYEFKIGLNIFRNKYGLKEITQISPLSPIVQNEEINDLFNKIENFDKIDTVTVTEAPKDILFINVDVINPDNIKKENILDDHQTDEKNKQENISTKKMITCEICSKQFLRQSNLTTHLKCVHSIHNTKRKLPLPYEICGKTFPTHRKLMAHNQTHMPIKERAMQTDEKNKPENISIKKMITCEICSKQFLRQSNLTTHLKSAHSIENTKKLLPCEICGKTFPTQQTLMAHNRTHIPIEERAIHQCPNCEQKLSCEGSLKQHIRSKHTGEKSFICDQCGKSFTTKYEMQLHKYVHDTDNELQCKKCNKIFKNERRLKVHMKVHRDKMYPCSICGLQLKTSQTLKNHLIIHTDEMPFNCNYCGATFRRDKNLRAHMIIHTGLKPYECPFCSQAYANRSNCKKHQKHSHPEEFAAMEASGIQHYSKNVPKLSQLQTMLEQMK